MENYVDGKVIIITGASSGFGKLVAEMAAEMGGKVVCAARREEELKNLVASIKEKGGIAEYIVTDMTQKDQVDKMAQFAIEKFGQIDVIVNNAGSMPIAFFADHKEAWKAWDQCFDLNLKGTTYGISAVYDQMIAQGRGQVVNVSSIFGNFPVPGNGVYQSTKKAIRYLTESLRQETHGVIKTTIVNPTGVFKTGLLGSVVNMNAAGGIAGTGIAEFMENFGKYTNGTMSEEQLDINSPKYWCIDPEALAQNIIYCINQPWGVSISEITVRSTGENYFL